MKQTQLQKKKYVNVKIITKSNKGYKQIIVSYAFDRTLKHLEKVSNYLPKPR